METIAASKVIAEPIREYLEATMGRCEADETAERMADSIEKLLAFHGYRIFGRAPETFIDDNGVPRDSQNGDIVSTFDWPTLDSVPVGVTRIASQSGRVAAFNQLVGWHWTDGEGFPEQESYDGPWCVASEVRP